MTRKKLSIYISLFIIILICFATAFAFFIRPPTVVARETLAYLFPNEIYFDNLTALSPNKRYYAIIKSRDLAMRGANLWIMNSDGTNKHIVANGDDLYTYISNPVWSPDGKRVFYEKINPFQFWSVNIDGSENKMLTNDKLLYTSFGYGGKANIQWTNDGISFINTASYPNIKYLYDPNSNTFKEAGLVNTFYPGDLSIANFPLMGQKDPTWGASQLGSCSGISIAQSGCTISAIAMNFKYFGLDVNP